MRKRKKMVLIFFIGLLLIGVGGGISFAEFTSFQYGGEKNFSGEMTGVTLKQTVPEDAKAVYLLLRGYDYSNVNIVADDSVLPGQLEIEVMCDKTYITPQIGEEPDYFENIDVEPDYLEDIDMGQDTASVAYSLTYYYHSSFDEVEEFFRIKDELLKDMKNRVVCTYITEYVQSVTIKAAPELAQRLIIR